MNETAVVTLIEKIERRLANCERRLEEERRVRLDLAAEVERLRVLLAAQRGVT